MPTQVSFKITDTFYNCSLFKTTDLARTICVFNEGDGQLGFDFFLYQPLSTT